MTCERLFFTAATGFLLGWLLRWGWDRIKARRAR